MKALIVDMTACQSEFFQCKRGARAVARKIAVVVGSIRKESINRKLAKALIKLAPKDLECELVRIDDLPVFNQDHDQDPPQQVARVKAQIVAADAILFVHPRTQPIAADRTEECPRLGIAALWQKSLGRQARRRGRRIGRRGRHRGGTGTSARRAGLSRRAHAGAAGSLCTIHQGLDRRRRQCQQPTARASSFSRSLTVTRLGSRN